MKDVCKIGLTPEQFWDLTPREMMYQLDGFAFREEQEFLRAGIIASTIANVNRDPKKRRKPFTPADFMPNRKKKEVQTPEVQAKILRLLTRAMGGDIRG